MTATMLDEYVDTDIRTSNEAGSVAHIVMSMDPTRSVGAYVTMARVEGVPLVALCGYIWVPSKDATKLPKCQKCLDIYESEDRSEDGNNDLPDAA